MDPLFAVKKYFSAFRFFHSHKMAVGTFNFNTLILRNIVSINLKLEKGTWELNFTNPSPYDFIALLSIHLTLL
jgi:hypothetical protein